MEEQLAAGLGERQIAEFIEHDEVEAGQIVGESTLPTATRLALQSIDEINDGVKAAARASADAGSRDGNGEMRLARACAADQNGIALLGDEPAGRQVAHQRLIDRRASEVEVADVL